MRFILGQVWRIGRWVLLAGAILGAATFSAFVWPNWVGAIRANASQMTAQVSQPTTPPTMAMPTSTPTRMPTSTMMPTSTQVPATAMPMQTPTMMSTPSATAQVSNSPTSAPQGVVSSQALTMTSASFVSGTVVTGTSSITPTVVITQGAWTITCYPGATAEMKAWKFQDPSPKDWSKFPNVTNTIGSRVYPASQGLEYGQDKDFACEGIGCFFVVSAQHYRIWSGDGAIPDLGYQCVSIKDGTGCAIMVVNVGTVTTEWEAILKRGFTIRGRYWDGKYLSQAIWAGLSHTAYNMLNMSKDSTNAGSNCSSSDGCSKVRVTFIVTSGKEILMKGTTIVAR